MWQDRAAIVAIAQDLWDCCKRKENVSLPSQSRHIHPIAECDSHLFRHYHAAPGSRTAIQFTASVPDMILSDTQTALIDLPGAHLTRPSLPMTVKFKLLKRRCPALWLTVGDWCEQSPESVFLLPSELDGRVDHTGNVAHRGRIVFNPVYHDAGIVRRTQEGPATCNGT